MFIGINNTAKCIADRLRKVYEYLSDNTNSPVIDLDISFDTGSLLSRSLGFGFQIASGHYGLGKSFHGIMVGAFGFCIEINVSY